VSTESHQRMVSSSKARPFAIVRHGPMHSAASELSDRAVVPWSPSPTGRRSTWSASSRSLSPGSRSGHCHKPTGRKVGRSIPI